MCGTARIWNRNGGLIGGLEYGDDFAPPSILLSTFPPCFFLLVWEAIPIYFTERLSTGRCYPRVRTSRPIVYRSRKVVPFSGICTGLLVKVCHILLRKGGLGHINTGHRKNNLGCNTRVSRRRVRADSAALRNLEDTEILSPRPTTGYNSVCSASTLVYHSRYGSWTRNRRRLRLINDRL